MTMKIMIMRPLRSLKNVRESYSMKHYLIFNMTDGSQFKSVPYDQTQEALRNQFEDLATAGSIRVDAELPATGTVVYRIVNPINVRTIDVLEYLENAD